ncbi:hypothetical protein [Hydrogenivirga sp. 128-5-R1-1]|uniref:hypothetical protein n=1 Tax=Hydrogenivirga sp. 128-5-R1-1 TaxID=392423 RepID=UPI00015F16BC|nr:hypothetical protein [Hydrogenivirga sp. 128-5-R1-1]EDP76058.1 hypothetical protein HG1285_17849 [Hydrogenivirga sp. 128-5-R1-1]
MKYYLSSKALVSLLFLGALFVAGCTSYVGGSSPEEVVKLYHSLLSSGDVKSAAGLRYNPAGEWGYMKEALGAAVVLALMSVVIRLTGLNPFSTMLNCWLIENFVSPENRKYVLYAVGVLFILTAGGIYFFLTTYLHRLMVNADRIAFENTEIEILETEMLGDRAFVYYVLTLPDGREVERRAELWNRDGKWLIRKP